MPNMPMTSKEWNEEVARQIQSAFDNGMRSAEWGTIPAVWLPLTMAHPDEGTPIMTWRPNRGYAVAWFDHNHWFKEGRIRLEDDAKWTHMPKPPRVI